MAETPISKMPTSVPRLAVPRLVVNGRGKLEDNGSAEGGVGSRSENYRGPDSS